MRMDKKRAQGRFYMRLIFAQRKEHGDYHQLVGELELGDSEYFPRYLRMTPDIVEDILWRVGPLLHGASISAVMICCNLDLLQMT